MISFFFRWNGKKNDNGTFPGQCVNLIKSYFKEVLGIEPILGNAIDYWKDIPGFKRIKKGLFTYPKPGDIVIWDKSYGQYGHIGIVNWVRTFDFGAFEQNNPVGSPCHFQDHTYKGVIGWLRPEPVKELRVAVRGLQIPANVADRIFEFSGGRIKATFTTYPGSPLKEFSTDEGMTVIESMKPAEKYVLLGCSRNDGFEKASVHPGLNKAFAICVPGASTADILHELLHCVRKWANLNHIKPYIEDVEKYPTQWGAGEYNEGWSFGFQYKQIIPYL